MGGKTCTDRAAKKSYMFEDWPALAKSCIEPKMEDNIILPQQPHDREGAAGL